MHKQIEKPRRKRYAKTELQKRGEHRERDEPDLNQEGEGQPQTLEQTHSKPNKVARTRLPEGKINPTPGSRIQHQEGREKKRQHRPQEGRRGWLPLPSWVWERGWGTLAGVVLAPSFKIKSL